MESPATTLDLGLGSLPVLDAAARLGIGKARLYGYLRTGELPSFKLGKRRMIPIAALDALIASRLESALTGFTEAAPTPAIRRRSTPRAQMDTGTRVLAMRRGPRGPQSD